MPQRRDYIDELKGLGILLVVFGHFIEQYRMNYSFISASFFCMYAFNMALFFICSGLVARWNPRKLVVQQLWIYLVGQALTIVFRIAVLGEDIAAEGGCLAALLLPWRHMWYLYALLLWELTLPLLVLLRDKGGIAGACLGFAGAVAVALAGGLVDSTVLVPRVFAFYPFYAFGVLFRPQIDRIAAFGMSKLGARLAALAVLIIGYGVYFCKIYTAEPILDNSAQLFHDVSYAGGDKVQYRIAFYLAGILTTLALVLLLSAGKRLTALGQHTLPIYLLHLPILLFLVQCGTYEPLRGQPLPWVLGWVVLQALGCICLLNSAPLQRVFMAAANVWYKRK